VYEKGDAVLSEERRKTILDRLRGIPILETLRMQIVSLGDGTCELRMPYTKNFDGVFESFHGGLLMTAADTAACFAVFTKTGPDAHMTTTDMSIRFLAPCLSDVTARARIIKFGRTLCPTEIDLVDAAGTRVAMAQVTYFLLDRIPHRGR